MSEHRERCGRCGAYKACRHAFGRYWDEKSDGGRGCDSPMRATEGWERFLAGEEAAAKRSAWERGAELAVTTRGRSAGVLCMSKRNGMARQGVMI